MKQPYIIGVSEKRWPYKAIVFKTKRGRRGAMPSRYARLRKRSSR